MALLSEASKREREMKGGGEDGIRTHGTFSGTAVFKTARFNRSRTSPYIAHGGERGIRTLEAC